MNDKKQQIAAQKPNIILINVDDLGYADVGCYGSKKNKTPVIDRMAQEGLLFTDFYAPAPVCTPSRAGMLTGCYPKRIDFGEFGVYDYREPDEPKDHFVVLMPGQPEGLNPNEKTIASILKDAGYHTAAIGKWHVGDQPEFLPTQFGFDYYYGLPYSNDMGLQTASGRLKELEYTLCPLPLMENDRIIDEQPDTAALTENYTREAIRFIYQNRAAPFFLYLAHSYIHHPLFVPEHFKKQSQNGDLGAAIAEIDWSLDRIQYELRKLNLEENTLIIFISDNGGDERSDNSPLRGFKGSVWEGGQRVNCIMKWPAIIPAGTRCSEITSMMDFFPTFAEIAGITETDTVIRDGYSLLPLMCSPNCGKTLYHAFYYYHKNELLAVRSGRYKLHILSGELYDLENDIGEKCNLAASRPDLVDTLLYLANCAREGMGDARTGSIGKNCRSKGFVHNFKPLTFFDPDAPYMTALYDIDDYNA